MSNVKILRRKREDNSKKTGLGKYADNVEKCLEGEGIEFDKIEFKIDASGGYFDLFMSGFVRPLSAVLKNRSKENIFHATDELCGIFFPITKGRKIVTVHHVPNIREYRGGIYYMMWSIVVKSALKNADRIITVSEQTRNEVLKRFKVDPGKVVCITNAVDDIFEVREDVGKERMIGCMGALIQRKNFSTTLRAFKILAEYPDMSDYFLEICGKGPEKEKLLEEAAGMGIINQVRIVSDLGRDEMVRFYNRSELIFNTSLHEGLGLVTLEAQKCGTPVLHLENARIPEEVTRYSVPCRDETDMAEKAYELIMNKEKYEGLSKTSKEYANSFGSGFCALYLGCIREKN